MSELRDAFDERLEEVCAYMDFLAVMEAEAQDGPPRFAGAENAVTPQQQKLLYASVYLQLYNLVEATMTLCIGIIAEAAARDEKWKPDDLSDELRREWVRTTACTHKDLNYENRLNAAVAVVDHLLDSQPVGLSFAIEKGGGGNWDDLEIEAMSMRLGCELRLSPAVVESAKRHVKDDQGALSLVKSRRNDLAHGSMSFAESAEEMTVSDLASLVNSVTAYLGEVVDNFDSYVESHGYLNPASQLVASSA